MATRKRNRAVCGAPVGKLTAAKRRRIPARDWGIWTGNPSTSKYPMPDQSHAHSAITYARRMRNLGHLTAAQLRKIERKAKGIIARCARTKKGNKKMARTAVVNKRRRRRPKAHGAARRRRRSPRRRNAGPANPRPSRYSSVPGGYYRRPNKRKVNPSLFKVDTWTKVLPPATMGVWLSRWAVKIAGPFKPSSTPGGAPEPGLEHAIAIALAAQIGAPFIGKLFGLAGAERATDYAQVGALAYLGDLFLRKRFLKNNAWVAANLNLDGFSNTSALGAHTMVDASGNQYNMQPGGGWQMAGGAGGGGNVGEYVMNSQTGEVYSVLNGGQYQYEAPSLQAFYNGVGAQPSAARILEAPTRDLPGGATPSDMSGFESSTPLAGSRSAENSFGYAPSRAA